MENIFSQKSRTLINVIGVPLLLFIIFKGGLLFAGFIFIAMIFCTKELHLLLQSLEIKIYKIVFYLFYFIFQLKLFLHILPDVNLLQIFLFFIFLLFVYQFLIVKTNTVKNLLVNFLSFFWVGLSLFSILLIRMNGLTQNNFFDINTGLYLTLVMFLSVWLCDTTAYILGSKFGKRKLCPSISPKKTWLGAIGGFISVFIFILMLYKYNFFNFAFDLSASPVYRFTDIIDLSVYSQFPYILNYSFSLLDVVIMTIIFGLISQIGDLFESFLKRKANVKDSGTILRGHGGVLDRMDSLLFVGPSFYLYLKVFVGVPL